MPEFVLPTDELFNQQWYLQIMRVPQAWRLLHNLGASKTFGSPDIVTAVCDRGILSQEVNGQATSVHPEFNGQVSNGKNKIQSFFDFTTGQPNNNIVTEDHGMNCAGLVAASQGGIKFSSGMMGVAPNTRLMAIKRYSGSYSEKDFAHQLLRMAGFYPPVVPTGREVLIKDYVYHPDKAADIISMSFSWVQRGTDNLDPNVVQAFQLLATKGRKGKGTIIVNASGNENSPISSHNAIPRYYQNCIVVGASTLHESGQEVFATYSNYGDDEIRISVVAPSSTAVNSNEQGTVITHNPPTSYGVLTTTLPGQGNVTRYPNHKNNFGGTSAAAPMVAGIAALMLTANPNLTAADVKRILIATADKIDVNTTDPVAIWDSAVPFPNFRPIPYSKKYGFGRVNAEKAVQAVIQRG